MAYAGFCLRATVPLGDLLGIGAGAAGPPALFPQLFPIPHSGRHPDRQWESELMREHTHLPAMVGLVSKHVAQHFQANRPGPSPAVSAKRLDPAPTPAQRFSKHLRAANGARGQSGTGLLRRAMRALELWWNLQVRSRQPDPLAADIVHVREDRRNGARAAGWFGYPDGRVKMFDKDLVDAIVGGKDPDCGSADLSVDLVGVNPVLTRGELTRGHGSLLLHQIILPGPRQAGTNRLFSQNRLARQQPGGSQVILKDQGRSIPDDHRDGGRAARNTSDPIA
jgi:hypothetical protein